MKTPKNITLNLQVTEFIIDWSNGIIITVIDS